MEKHFEGKSAHCKIWILTWLIDSWISAPGGSSSRQDCKSQILVYLWKNSVAQKARQSTMAAMQASYLHLSEQKVTINVPSSSKCLRGTFCGDNYLSNSSISGVKVSFAQRSVQHARKSLTIEAAKKVSSSRSYVLTATLVAKEGSEEAAMKLCKGILAWAEEKKVILKCLYFFFLV